MIKTIYTKDLVNNKILVTREFAASIEKVWSAWTEPELLDQWWAPKPWQAKTKSMDFREGGTWLYSMEGPDGIESFCRADYKTIVPRVQYIGLDAFCDEKGNINDDFPRMKWKCDFSKSGTGTIVKVEITFDSQAGLEKIVEMGFEAGFAMAHENLDELLAK